MQHYYADREFKAGEVVAVQRLFDKPREELLHDHDFVEIVYIISGHGDHYINKKKYSVTSGDLLFINYGCTHSFVAKDELNSYNVLIKIDYIEQLMNNNEDIFYLLSLTSFERLQEEINGGSPLASFAGPDKYKIELILSKIEEELNHDGIGKSSMLKSYICILLTEIFRKIFNLTNDDESKFEQIIDYIQSNCDQKLSLSELANKSFYNPSYFSRIFKETYNMTLSEYIIDQRLKKSCHLLANTKLSTAEIAARCGFSGQSFFYTRFKNAYGCTPNEYRKTNKQHDE